MRLAGQHSRDSAAQPGACTPLQAVVPDSPNEPVHTNPVQAPHNIGHALSSAANEDDFIATQTPRSASLRQQQSQMAVTPDPANQECLVVTQISMPANPAAAVSQQYNQQGRQVQVQEDKGNECNAAECTQSVLANVRPPLHPASLQPAEFDVDIEVPLAGL